MKKRQSYNISIGILEKLDSISRNELKNKSMLVEELLKKWLDKREKILKNK